MNPARPVCCFFVVVALQALATLLVTGCAPTPEPPPPPIFSSIPGATVGGKPIERRSQSESLTIAMAERDQVEIDEDGNITLNSTTVQSLIENILFTLDENRPDLFVEQLMSERTRTEFIQRGFDPATAFDELRRRERPLRELFTRLPAGEFTPGVFMRPQGGGVYRLQVQPTATMHWRGLDVLFEKRNWRLRWFVN